MTEIGNLFRDRSYVYFLIGFITLSSFIEELAARVYPFENLCNRIHPIILAIASSAVFTAGHFLANKVSIPYALALMLYGLLFSYVYFQTDSIWAVVGVHHGTHWFAFIFFGNRWKIGHVYETAYAGVPKWIAEYSGCFATLLAIGFVFFLTRLGLISHFFGITRSEAASAEPC